MKGTKGEIFIYGTWWSIVPPIVAILLAFITKEVYVSLFCGVLLGAMFTAGFQPWGTFAILVPIVVSMYAARDEEMMVIAVSAVLAGAVCGDHISPISDTTIMSSSGAQSNHINHVQTQMQYAMVVAVICVIGYVIAGLSKSWAVSLGSSALLLTAALYAIRRREKGIAV